MKKTPFFLIILLLTAAGCEDPKAVFTGPFPKKNVNLERRWGKQAILYIQGDTARLDIKFVREGRKNLITLQGANDTAFYGDITYYRGLYYVSNVVDDSTYLIYPYKLYGDSVKGFQSELTFIYAWDDRMNEARYRSMIVGHDAEKDLYRLKPNAKLIHELFSSMIDTVPAIRVAKQEE